MQVLKIRMGAKRWMCAMLAFVACGHVHAASVYKCVDAAGHVAYQDHVCTTAQKQSEVEVLPPPPAAKSPDYGMEKPSHGRALHETHVRVAGAQPHGHGGGQRSYECRTSDGEVFYRHSGCPHSVDSRSNPRQKVSVSTNSVSRSHACERIAEHGAIGRKGHEHDEGVSAYDRRAGHDPCQSL